MLFVLFPNPKSGTVTVIAAKRDHRKDMGRDGCSHMN